jgi:hypothetical protein
MPSENVATYRSQGSTRRCVCRGLKAPTVVRKPANGSECQSHRSWTSHYIYSYTTIPHAASLLSKPAAELPNARYSDF